MVVARPGSFRMMVDTESGQLAQWAPSRVLTTRRHVASSTMKQERGLLKSTPADIVRVDTDDLTQTLARFQVVRK